MKKQIKIAGILLGSACFIAALLLNVQISFNDSIETKPNVALAEMWGETDCPHWWDVYIFGTNKRAESKLVSCRDFELIVYEDGGSGIAFGGTVTFDPSTAGSGKIGGGAYGSVWSESHGTIISRGWVTGAQNVTIVNCPTDGCDACSEYDPCATNIKNAAGI